MVPLSCGRVLSTAVFLAAVALHGQAWGQLLGDLSQPIIYAADDRVEVYQVTDAALRQRAQSSTVSFMYRSTLDYQQDGTVALRALAYDEIYDLCVDEPFQGQPAAAWCTGVLIDDDLVLTAGHCLGEKPSQVEATCASLAVTFGYYLESAERLATIEVEDVFRCRRVVAWSQDSMDLDAADYAIIQLDKSAVPRHEAVDVRLNPMEVGEAVAVVTHGAGLPAKVDQGGVVVDTTSFGEYFRADTDTFEGASGSPVFDEQSQLVAVHTRGNPDWDYSAQCTAAVRTETGAEDHQIVSSPLAELCSQQWPSEALCGIAPTCGDEVCSAQERNATCPEDCPLQRCGDGICERDEPLDCAVDCDAFASVPPQWTCPPEYYRDANGCDCDCGVWDPDCDDPEEAVLNCSDESICLDGGICQAEAGFFLEEDEDGWGCSTSPSRGGGRARGAAGPPATGGASSLVTLLVGLWLVVRRRRHREI